MLKIKESKSIILAVVFLLLLMIFASPAMASPGAHILIQPDQLNGLIHSKNVVVIDVSPKEATYNSGHIPGAVWVTKDDFYQNQNQNQNLDSDQVASMAAKPEELALLLSDIGVTPKTHVVIYTSAKDTKLATRVWWVLNMYGHTKAQVLDGGFDAWIASGYEGSTESVTPIEAIYPEAELVTNDDTVATLDEVKTALELGTPVIDCRSLSTYNSKHIPGAILIPETDMYNSDDNTFKDKNVLKKYFADKGITEKTPIITYCNTGTTATVQYLVLAEIIGCKNVQNYDGSLAEWKTPICNETHEDGICEVDVEVED